MIICNDIRPYAEACLPACLPPCGIMLGDRGIQGLGVEKRGVCASGAHFFKKFFGAGIGM